MIIFVAVLLLIIGGLSFYLVRFWLELKHMDMQLEALEKGSEAQLSSHIAVKSFRKVYGRLNRITAAWTKRQYQYRHAQDVVKHSITGMAHDIRTPLTSASGYLQMLQEYGGDEQQQRYQRIVKGRLDELKDMLDELFLYTRLADEEYEIECDFVAVYPVLSECMMGMYHMFEERGIEPEVDFENEEWGIMGNQEALERVFRNLIGNGLVHGSGSMRITQAGKSISFANTVADGERFDVERIFERFYKGDRSRKKGSSGLGLAIVKELVERMGGEVSASSGGGWLVITILFDK